MQTAEPSPDRRWEFLTNHARVLICVADNPGVRVRDIADRVGVTQRATQIILDDLEEAGYLTRTRVGRRNTYQLDLTRPSAPHRSRPARPHPRRPLQHPIAQPEVNASPAAPLLDASLGLDQGVLHHLHRQDARDQSDAHQAGDQRDDRERHREQSRVPRSGRIHNEPFVDGLLFSRAALLVVLVGHADGSPSTR
ncbi:helix-turn-helix domain-containing protein [Spirillospora sp. NPDC047279]|uniref:helix-turn-helix transcriptional regulator n=1 Tax=Spirillospora sp. NPDC047279 TaxID=3155478 RepID=UPI0033DFDE00